MSPTPFGPNHHRWDGLTQPTSFPFEPIDFQVSGELACFTRPEFSSERVSYPILTPTAAIGITSSIYWKPQIRWVVTQIDVLAPVSWSRMHRNEVGSPVSADNVSGETPFDVEKHRQQRNTLMLRDVHYRIHVQPWLHPDADAREGLNHPAKHREMLSRRISKGQAFRQPSLGIREFVADVTPSDGRPRINWTEDLGVMLHSIIVDDSGHESYDWFDARVLGGVMSVPRLGLMAQHNAQALAKSVTE